MNRVVVVESDKWNTGPSIQCTNAKKKTHKKSKQRNFTRGEKKSRGVARQLSSKTTFLFSILNNYNYNNNNNKTLIGRHHERIPHYSYSDHRHCP